MKEQTKNSLKKALNLKVCNFFEKKETEPEIISNKFRLKKQKNFFLKKKKCTRKFSVDHPGIVSTGLNVVSAKVILT